MKAINHGIALAMIVALTACTGETEDPPVSETSSSDAVVQSSVVTQSSEQAISSAPPQSSAAQTSSAPSLVKPGAGYSALPNERGTYNYEQVLIDEQATGFDKAASLNVFKETLYPHLRSLTCAACHNSAVPSHLGGSQAPLHADNDVELAHEYALTRVNFKDPRNSKFVVRMEIDRHNCGGPCDAAGRDMLDAVLAWKEGIEHMLEPTPRGVPAGQNISTSQIESWIATDKQTLPSADRKYYVYTSMHELHNEGLTADELNIVRVGLSKALNSVARWAPEIVNPTDVNGQGILYRFDMRDYWAWSKLERGQELFFGGSDDDLAFGAQDGSKRDYRGNVIEGGVVGSGTQGDRFDYANEVWYNPDHAWQVWERILHGNVEGALQNGNLDPNIRGFKGSRKTNAVGEYVDINAFEWVEASQLVYTLTRPDVYNAIMAIPFFMDQLEQDDLNIDRSQGADSYDWTITFDAITVDSRLLFRAKRPGDSWYWKSFDIFSGQLEGGDQNIFDVYREGGTNIRFPWWANPIPKFVKWLQLDDDNTDFSFVASLNQTANFSGFGFASPNTAGCDNQNGFVQGFGNCRHYTGVGGAMQSAEEIIFDLPNGLQGYALAGGFNQRRVDAFTNIVRDPRILTEAGDNIAHATGYSYSNPGGGFLRQADPRLNNGSSCIGCHADGMNRMGNDMRNWLDNAQSRLPTGPYGVDDWINDPQTVARVRELYPEENYVRDMIEDDRLGFLEAFGKIKEDMILGNDKNVYVEPIIWTVEYAQREKYNYPQTTSN